MIQVCRYWPGPCYMSAATIAENCGLAERYVRNIITELSKGAKKRKDQAKPARKRYIKRSYGHAKKNGQPYTCRVIVPLCFPPGRSAHIAPRGAHIVQGQRTYSSGRAEPGRHKSAHIEPPTRTVLENNRNKNRSATSPSPSQSGARSLKPLTERLARKYTPLDGKSLRQRKALLSRQADMLIEQERSAKRAGELDINRKTKTQQRKARGKEQK